MIKIKIYKEIKNQKVKKDKAVLNYFLKTKNKKRMNKKVLQKEK